MERSLSKAYLKASDQRPHQHQRCGPTRGVVVRDFEPMPKVLFQLFVRAPSYLMTKCVAQLYLPLEAVLFFILLLVLLSFVFPDRRTSPSISSVSVVHAHYSSVKTKTMACGIVFAEARVNKKSRKSGPTLPMPPFIAHRASAFASNEHNAEMVREWYARELLERKRAKDIEGGGDGGRGLSNQKLGDGDDEDQKNAQGGGGGGIAAADTLGLGPLSSFNSRLGRENINRRDAFWRAGWQPVPMHAMLSSYEAVTDLSDENNNKHKTNNGRAPSRIPYAHEAMEVQPIEPSGLDTIIGRSSLVYEYAKKIATTAAAEGRKVSVADLRISQEILEKIARSVVADERAAAPAMSVPATNRINLTSYSYEVPNGHKIFLHVSPNVDDLPRRHLDAFLWRDTKEGNNIKNNNLMGSSGGRNSRLYGPSSLSKEHPANPLEGEDGDKEKGGGNSKSITEHWAGMCSAKTGTDWCFITIGCWGSGNIQTQTRVAKAMATVLERYAGRDLFPHRRRSSSPKGEKSLEGKKNYIEHPPALHHRGNNNNNYDGDHNNYVIRPCDVRFGTINGDNFYESGILRADTTRLVTGFELIYGSPTLLAMPWLVSLGNHDYRGDWFQQTALMNRPVVNSWGKVGHAGPDDIEIGDWVKTMNDSTTALTTPSSSSMTARQRPLRPLRAADVALLKKEQTFSTGRWYLPHPYYSARMSKELVMITLDCPLLERCHNNGDESPRCWDHGQQKGWLQGLLKTLDYDADLKYRIIQCHYPLYANGPHVNHQWLIDFIEPLMVRHGVQLYINADNHYIQVSKKTAIGGFGEKGKIANLNKENRLKREEAEENKNEVLRLEGAGDYFFVNSGGGGGYGLNHHRTDKGYATNPFNVFDEIRNGPFFHCLRDVGTPDERLVTIAYNDDGEKLYEFVVRPYVSPIATETNKARRFIEEQVRLYFLAEATEESKKKAIDVATPQDNGEENGDELIVQKKQQGNNHNEKEQKKDDEDSNGNYGHDSSIFVIGGEVGGDILRRGRESGEVDVNPGFTYVLVIVCCFCAFAFIVTRRYTSNGRRGGSAGVGVAGASRNGHVGGAYAAGPSAAVTVASVVLGGGGGASSPSLHGFTARSSSAAAAAIVSGNNAAGVVVGSSPAGVEMIRLTRERN